MSPSQTILSRVPPHQPNSLTCTTHRPTSASQPVGPWPTKLSVSMASPPHFHRQKQLLQPKEYVLKNSTTVHSLKWYPILMVQTGFSYLPWTVRYSWLRCQTMVLRRRWNIIFRNHFLTWQTGYTLLLTWDCKISHSIQISQWMGGFSCHTIATATRHRTVWGSAHVIQRLAVIHRLLASSTGQHRASIRRLLLSILSMEPHLLLPR